jgi:hypothetical protein
VFNYVRCCDGWQTRGFATRTKTIIAHCPSERNLIRQPRSDSLPENIFVNQFSAPLLDYFCFAFVESFSHPAILHYVDIMSELYYKISSAVVRRKIFSASVANTSMSNKFMTCNPRRTVRLLPRRKRLNIQNEHSRNQESDRYIN